MMHSQFDDIQLMRRIAAQDEHAFHAIYLEYGKAIFSLAYRILQNVALAEEVTQDTFLKVWRQTTQWDPKKGNLKNWLLAITHHTAIDRLRLERRQPAVHPDAIEDVEGVASFSTEPGWQDGVVLRTLTAQLTDDQAMLIDLAFFQGMSHSEIADRTKIPLGTVKTRLRAALVKLRELWLQTVV
ncbi:MAG TPA: sigma-70 family RNA polymerase sigma factor [Aggregatilineales bacterium]|nr:sigma-70 family RNA polymerase sigma factor [Aggregatilineales bacterium]